ncbi:hypothetical protein ACPVTF_16195 [Geobacillus icigianus]|uniref:hypothetical protein n=1 Tax=Geobacillus icigianus TaxID=1430331 RepID=UPI003D02A998
MNYLILIKFGKYEHMIQMQKGYLRFSPLSVYRDLETETKNSIPLRYDPFEGTSTLYSPETTLINIAGKTIDSSELIGPIRLSKNDLEKTPVFCMYAITESSIKNFLNGEKSYVVHPKTKEFGDTALVITDTPRFLERLDEALGKWNFNFHRGLVEYIDPNKHQGEWGAFKKPIEYEYQSEYRITIDNKKITEPFFLEIGDISDISLIIDSSELPNKIEIGIND